MPNIHDLKGKKQGICLRPNSTHSTDSAETGHQGGGNGQFRSQPHIWLQHRTAYRAFGCAKTGHCCVEKMIRSPNNQINRIAECQKTESRHTPTGRRNTKHIKQPNTIDISSIRFSTASLYLIRERSTHPKTSRGKVGMPSPKTMPSASDEADCTKLAAVATSSSGEDSSHFRTIYDRCVYVGRGGSEPTTRRKHPARDGLFPLTKKHGDIPGT